MPDEFINPNWHVVLIHYPLGLLTMGVLIELFSRRCACEGIRAAGRWMILIGALFMFPALASGLYAMRDVVAGGPSSDEQTWQQVKQASPWVGAQWLYMKRHILLMGLATCLALLTVATWAGATDDSRQRLRWPALSLILLAAASMGVGAWYAGEAVYRYGTGIERVSAASAPTCCHGVNYFVPPLQLHLVLVGLAVAAIVAAAIISFRRWSQQQAITVARTDSPETSPPPHAAHAIPLPYFPAKFWLLALGLGAAAIAAGLWTADDWKSGVLLGPLHDWATSSPRLFWHVIFGAAIAVLIVILAIVSRASWWARAPMIALMLLLALAVAGQVWLGVLLLFDTTHGPLTGFNA